MIRIICLFFPFLFLSFGPHRPAPVRKGQDLAVFFAVDNYRHSNLADLQNPVKNATDIAGVLHKRFGFDTLVVRNPTQVQIEQKLNELEDRYARNLDGRAPSSGQLLVFFSGHGKEYYGDGYFLPADADPAAAHRTGLGYIYLRYRINAINCDHVLVAVDACFSANFDPDKGNKPDREFKRLGELSEAEKILFNHRNYKARLFFTSDAVGDMTPDRSNFARKILEGLDAFQSPAGFMTSSELFANYIEKASPTPHGGDFGDDDPRSAFLFFYEKSDVDPFLDRQAWEDAKAINTLAAYKSYRSRFPNGDFRPLADKRIAEFEDYEAWQQAKAAGTKVTFVKYLDDYPSGGYSEVAILSLEKLVSRIDSFEVVGLRQSESGRHVKKIAAKNVQLLEICQLTTKDLEITLGQKLYIQIIDPNGVIQFNEELGSGIIKSYPTQRRIQYTLLAELEKIHETGCVQWMPNTPFIPGAYKVNIYSYGFLVGSQMIVLK
jgi:hypothetical protein